MSDITLILYTVWFVIIWWELADVTRDLEKIILELREVRRELKR